MHIYICAQNIYVYVDINEDNRHLYKYVYNRRNMYIDIIYLYIYQN